MSQELNKIKKRIKSVSSTYKITSAMKLVSTVKLKKWKNKMLANKDYNFVMDEIVHLVVSSKHKLKSPLLKVNDKATKNLYVIISSSLGLCGSYNHNIFDVAEVSLKKEDDAIILGQKGLMYFQDGDFTKIDDFSSYHSIMDTSIIKEIVSYILEKYIQGLYQEVHIIYTEYKNSLVFLAKDYLLLPFKVKENEEENKNDDNYVILEPTPQKLIDTLMDLYLKEEIYMKLLESEVCEQAARSNAMENATDNAKEILDDLAIKFNKARQGSITQEITEIVSAANAL